MIERVFLTKEQESVFSEEERKEIIQVMRDVGAGKLTQSQAATYCEMIAKAVKSKTKPPKCRECNDTGLVTLRLLKGSINTFKCKCR